MKKAKHKVLAAVMGLAMIVSSLLSVVPAQAAVESSQPQGTQASSASDNPTGNIAIKLNGGVGSVTFTGKNDTTVKASVSNDGKYTVTQKDGTTVNPSANDDGVIYTYTEETGQNVKVKVTPDDGYQISHFSLTDYSGSYKTINGADTNFDVDKGTATIDVDFAKTNGTDAKTQVSEKEVNQAANNIDESSMGDPVVAAYLIKNVDKKYANVDKIDLANIIRIKQTLVQASDQTKGMTLDALHSSDDNFNQFASVMMGQIDTNAAVYNVDDKSDYYVAYVNTMQNDASASVLDYEIANNNLNGEVLKGAIYDKNTGIAYIPKDLYNVSETKRQIFKVQIQLLQAISTDGGNASSTSSVATQSNGDDIQIDNKTTNIYQKQCVQTNKNLDPDKLVVSVNGIPVTKDMYKYDAKTGQVVINGSPASVGSVTINGENQSAASKIKAILSSSKVKAYSTITWDQMDFANSTAIPGENLQQGALYTGTVPLRYARGTKPGSTAWSYEYRSRGGANVRSDVGGKQMLENFIRTGSGNIPSSGWVKANTGASPKDFVNFYVDFGSGSATAFVGSNGKTQDFRNLNTLALECGDVSIPGITHTVKAGASPNPVMMRAVYVNKEAAKPYAIFAVLTAERGHQAGIGLFKFFITGKPPATLRLHKANQHNANIAGATFRLQSNDSGVFYDRSATTDQNGNVTFTEIPDGNYTLTETNVPSDYFALVTTYNVVFKNNRATITDSNGKNIPASISGRTNSASLVNYDKGKFNLVKYEYGNSSKKLEGATFKLTGPNGYVQEKVTNGNGLITFTQLMPGTYDLVEESSAPNHNTLSIDQTSWKVIVSKDSNQNFSYVFQNSSGNRLGTSYAVLSSVKQNGFHTLLDGIKFKLQGTSVLDRYKNTVPAISANTNAASTEINVPNRRLHDLTIRKTDLTKHNLEGAKFNLESVDDSFSYSDSEKTDQDGIAKFTYLPEGTYKLWENYAPNGYMKDKTIYTVVVRVSGTTVYDEAGKVVDLNSSKELTVPNTEKGHFDIKKTEDGTGKLLSDATFILSNSDNSYIKAAKTKSDGIASFQNLSQGTYTLRESKAAPGYAKLTKTMTVTVSKEGVVSIDTNGLSNVTMQKDSRGSVILITVPNTPVKTEPGKFKLCKVDASTGKPLTGAQWKIYKYDITGTQDSPATNAPCNLTALEAALPPDTYATLDADSNGEAEVTGLKKGVYLIRETKAPANYYKTQDDPKRQEEVPFAAVVDGDGNVSMYKQSADGTSYDQRFADNNLIDMSNVKNNVPVFNYDNQKYLDIKLRKRDSQTHDVLANATFTLTNRSDTADVKTGTSGSDGTLTFTNVKAGKYILQETKSPTNYQLLSEKWYLTVDVDGNVTFTES